VSVETGTRKNLTIVDGLTAPPDKPAAAPLGASGQWQMLQPAGPRGPQRTAWRWGAPPPAPPEAQIKGVSASNDLWIGAPRLSRSSRLTRSGGLCPACLPLDRSREPPSESSTGGSKLQRSQRVPGRSMPEAAESMRPCPSHGLTATPTAQNTSHTPTRRDTLPPYIAAGTPTGRPIVGTPRALACLSFRAGEGLRPCWFVHRENLCAVPANREAVHSARNQGAN